MIKQGGYRQKSVFWLIVFVVSVLIFSIITLICKGVNLDNVIYVIYPYVGNNEIGYNPNYSYEGLEWFTLSFTSLLICIQFYSAALYCYNYIRYKSKVKRRKQSKSNIEIIKLD